MKQLSIGLFFTIILTLIGVYFFDLPAAGPAVLFFFLCSGFVALVQYLISHKKNKPLPMVLMCFLAAAISCVRGSGT